VVKFFAELQKIGEEKAEIKTKQQADELVLAMKQHPFVVKDVKKKDKNRYPDAPFITSTLQQESFNKLKYNATKTMILAQQLYEGVDNRSGCPGRFNYLYAYGFHQGGR